MNFEDLTPHIKALTESAGNILVVIPAGEWELPYAGSSAWTKSELLGHLIDSAINNQQRFARALIEDELRFPSYPQNEMVRVQRYRVAPVTLLIELWSNLNRYMAHLLLQVPPDKLATRCTIGTNLPMTLEQLAKDYVAHLEHHLKQLVGKDVLRYSDLTWPPADRWQAEISATSKL